MKIVRHIASAGILSLTAIQLTSCGSGNTGNLGSHPTPMKRSQDIASEPRGNFYYGRRYVVEHTRFWGYVRKPGQPWSAAKLVVINEDLKRQPDRLPEDGPTNARFGLDQNYEYRLFGSYTGQKAYDPNSNQILPEFRLSRFELVNKDPGWLFSPSDRYDPKRITLTNSSLR